MLWIGPKAHPCVGLGPGHPTHKVTMQTYDEHILVISDHRSIETTRGLYDTTALSSNNTCHDHGGAIIKLIKEVQSSTTTSYVTSQSHVTVTSTTLSSKSQVWRGSLCVVTIPSFTTGYIYQLHPAIITSQNPITLSSTALSSRS
jgi:hypothetical protein